MHARPDIAAQHKMVDDGSGEAEVSKHWRISLARSSFSYLDSCSESDCVISNIGHKLLDNTLFG